MAMHSFQCQFCGVEFSSSIQIAQHWQDQHQDHEIGQETPVYELLQSAPFHNSSAGDADLVKEQTTAALEQVQSTGTELTADWRCDKKLASVPSVLEEHIHSGQEVKEHTLQSRPCVLKSDRSNKEFCCEICGRTYSTTSNLYKHSRTHTGVRYECRYCSKCFRYQETLKRHEQNHLNKRIGKRDSNRTYQCPYCKEVLPDKQRLGIHLRSHPHEKPHKCDQCELTFQHKAGLDRHRPTHSSVKPHSCRQCGRAFSKPESLRSHLKTHSGERRYSCSICGKAFTQKQTLLQHVRIHKDTKSYKCPHCGKGFRQRSTLWGHVRIHKRENIYQCSMCNEMLSTRKELQRHEKTHWLDARKKRFLGDAVQRQVVKKRAFVCEDCGEAFTQKAVLQTHRRRHTGDLPFSCEACGKRFRHLASHRRHALIHLGVKKYKCDVCPKSFTKKSYLQWHLKKFHPEQDSDKGIRALDGDSQTSETAVPSTELEKANQTLCSSLLRDACIAPVGEKKSLQKISEAPNCEDEVELGEDSTSTHSNDEPAADGTSSVHALCTGQEQDDHNMTNMGFVSHDVDQGSHFAAEDRIIVAFQDVCDVPINEECVQTMNLLDHVMQLAQISQKDLQDSELPTDVDVSLKQTDLQLGSTKQDTEFLRDQLSAGLSNERPPEERNSSPHKQFICEQCGRMYKSNSSLLRHKQSHFAPKPHKCHICNKAYSRGPILREHIQFAHSDHFKSHKCRHCAKAFPSAARLVLHMHIHAADKPYKCALCLKEFSDPSNFQRHQRSHRASKTHRCGECGCMFSEKPALRKHLRRHQGERTFQCLHCDKAFVLKTDLQSHSLIHAAAVEPKCSLCGMMFKRQLNFQRHQARSKKSTRKCRICSLPCPNDCTRRQHEIHEHKFVISHSEFSCGGCKTSFDSLRKVVSHLRKHCGVNIKP